MAIENPNLVYSPRYDLYVDRKTYAIFKRNNRNRKTEIVDSELVPLTIHVTYNGYLQFHDSMSRTSVCISRVYADAFPELVEGSDLHQMDPQTYCELDHRNHVTDTIEANFPSNLRWVSRTINRADTSRRRVNQTEQQQKRSASMHDWYMQHREDPDWLAHRRAKCAERKRVLYYERKESMKAHKAEVNEQMKKLAKKGGK